MIRTIFEEVSNEGILEKKNSINNTLGKEHSKESTFEDKNDKELEYKREELESPVSFNNNENFDLLARKLKALTSRINTFELDSPRSPEAFSPVTSPIQNHDISITTADKGTAIRSSKSLSSSDDTTGINPNLHISGKHWQPRSKSTPPVNRTVVPSFPYPSSISPTSNVPPRITTTSPYKGEGALISAVTPSTRKNSAKKLIFDENNFQIPFSVSMSPPSDSFQNLMPNLNANQSLLPAPTATKKTPFVFDIS